MDTTRRSSGRDCPGEPRARRRRRLIAATARLAAIAAFAVLAAAVPVGTAHAQHRAAAKPRPPAVKPAVTPGAPARPGAPQPDLAFGAFQRGYYLSAFSLATQRAVEKDDPKSMTLLGELYANGLGVPQNDAKAADWYRLAAARGDANAMFALAMFSLQARAGARDREASAKWLAAAAKLDHPIAAYDLALLYMEGELFPRDFTRAAQLLRIAADAGNPEAQYALGTLYKDGHGVPKDVREAVRLFSLASIADQTDAEVEYGIALFNGDGVERNRQLAETLFHKAALKGNPIAQDRLAIILANGLGVQANPVEAAKWHLISKATGETDLPLDDFVNRLDAKTREAAEKAAKPWIEAIRRTIAARVRPVPPAEAAK